ncbi:MAG: hypothetical protein H0W84_03210 [Bacteroidetes bacterium]|nr:hypothetical protein [Bacteroidota bacterium]
MHYFFGGNKSFWRDTVSTIIDRSFYEIGYNHWFQWIVKGFVVLVLLSAGGYLVLQFFKKQVSTNKLFLSSLFLIAGISIVSTIIQHHFLGTLYLMDRTVLFLLVLFNLLLVFFINEISKTRKLVAWITHLFAVSVIIHFVLSFNFKYVLEWKLNADTKEMLTDLEKIKEIPKEKNNVSVGIPLMFETDINYYRDIKNLSWLNTVSRSTYTTMLHDYFYLAQKDLAKLNPDSIEIIKTYPITKNVLAKPKYRFRNISAGFDKELYFEKEPVQRFYIESHIEYSPGFTYIINDSIASIKNAVLIFKTKVMTYAIKNSNLSIVVSLQNADGCYLWQNAYIRDYIKEENVWTDVYFSCIVPPEVKAGDELKVYIWNQNKQELFVKSMNLKWLQYQ